MSMVHVLLSLCLALPMAAGAPNVEGRRAAKASAYQELVRRFGVPKAYWNGRQVAQVPGDLRSALGSMLSQEDGCGVLGVLDCIDDLDTLTPEETALQAQVAWSESFYQEGERCSRATPLGPLFQAMDQERRGKAAPDGPSLALLKANRFLLARQEITWRPLRKQLLAPLVDSVLASPTFLAKGALPDGFDPRWLAGCRGPAGLWDQAWRLAWTRPDPLELSELLERVIHYRPEGLDPEQSQALEVGLLEWQGLPYQWGESSAPSYGRLLPSTFWRKVQAVRLPPSAAREAVAALSQLATQPRDFYEVVRILDALDTEADLKEGLELEAQLGLDPGLAGWTAKGARTRHEGRKARYESLVAARLEQAARLAEARRAQAEAERQKAAALKAREQRRHQDAVAAGKVAASLRVLTDAASMSASEKAAANAFIKKSVNGAHGSQDGQGTAIEAKK